VASLSDDDSTVFKQNMSLLLQMNKPDSTKSKSLIVPYPELIAWNLDKQQDYVQMLKQKPEAKASIKLEQRQKARQVQIQKKKRNAGSNDNCKC
jgi:hypothetical protein